MKIFNAILFHLLILLSLNGQDHQTINVRSLQPYTITDFRYKVIGPVKSILETSYTLDAQQMIIKKGWDVPWESHSKLYFDREGTLLKVEYLNDDGSVGSSDLNEYLDGRLIKFRRKFFNAVLIYNDAGILVEEYHEVSKPILGNHGYDRPLPSTYQSKLRYSYNATGDISKIITTGSKGDTIVQAMYHYTGDSKIPYEIIDDRGEWGIDTYAYTYHDGAITQIQRIEDGEGLIEQYDYSYENGQLVEENSKYYQEGQYVGDLVYKFENYNEVEVYETDEHGNLDYRTIYTYDFDDRGNWIRKYFTEKDKNYMVKREIVYWE